MLKITVDAWQAITAHLAACYPKEGCGVMLGTMDADLRKVTLAVPCRNVFEGEQKDRFKIDSDCQMAAEKRARQMGIELVGFFHSHPDENAYFSETDLKNSWPVYSNLVVSVRHGSVAGAAAFITNADCSAATPEALEYPKDS